MFSGAEQGHQFDIDILGYREDGEWVALALDMDLRGYGSTIDESFHDLMDHVRMQVSFALQKDNIDLIYHPAEKQYYELYEKAEDVTGIWGGVRQ